VARPGPWAPRLAGAASVLALALLAAAAARIVPARRSDMRLRGAAAAAAARAAALDEEGIVAEIRGKAAEYGIPEAAAPGAVRAFRAGGGWAGGGGVCAVRLTYSRRVDLYGLASVRLRTDAEIVRAFPG